ncbi:MAG: S41 family peptidase [Candidatus Omnitrophota bacterium]
MRTRIAKIVIASLCCMAMLGPAIRQGMCGQTNTVKDEAKKESTSDIYEQVELLADALSTIRSDFVDQVRSKELVYGALRGMLAGLDDYSQFLDPDEYDDIKAETKGEFGGVGIEISMRDRILTVIAPIAGSPASRQGVQAGDRIVKIDGEITKEVSLSQAVKKLRGKPGTDVGLTLWREKDESLHEVAITRAIIKIDSIKNAQIVEDNIGYIKLVEFQENTFRDLGDALKKLKADGMNALILDLRDNPGGLLDSSVDVSGLFLEKGATIVSTKARIKAQNAVFPSETQGPYTDFPLVVLVSGGSASASEIVAGAIQDNRRGIVVGVPTYGKGSVQTIMPMRDGSALRLTTASYFTPNGRSIRKQGILPDVVVEWETPKEKKEKRSDIFKELEQKAEKKEKEPDEDTIDPERDNQLRQAIDILKGIRIFRTFEESKA